MRASALLGPCLGVLLALGGAPPHVASAQDEFDDDPEAAAEAVHVNFTGAVSSTLAVTAQMRRQGHGHVVVMSSVAGERGRASNYVYGSAKAGLSAFLSGLRSRMQKVDVPVLTVKPGFVDTAMTFGREGMRKVATPESVGKAVVRAIKRRKDVVYVPGIWRWIMLVIKLIPERAFKKLKF